MFSDAKFIICKKLKKILRQIIVSKNIYFRIFLIPLFIILENCSFPSNYKGNYIELPKNYPEAPLVSEVLMHLQLDYVNQKKLDPKILLEGALTELERVVPEVWVFLQLSKNGFKPSLRVLIEKNVTILPISELNGLYDLQTALKTLIKLLLENDIQLSQLQIEHLFVRGILNKLDSYSVLLPSEIYREFNINIGGQFAGVGLVVGMRDGRLTVIAPMDGSPASRAGIKPLDQIVAVDEEKTEHLTLEEILYRLRGNTGTPVVLTVFRKRNAKTFKFVLMREEIKVESIEAFDLVNKNLNYRYIRIKNFQIDTSKELKNKIKNLNGINGLIIDLRNNPGGLLDEAVSICDLFLPEKKRIVSTKGPSVSSTHDSKKLFSGELLEKIPLVLLINEGSASASEIVAAALKQSERAILIGEKSFGKGTVQTLWDMKDGSGLKLTIGEYLTPSGSSIDNIGVMPSIILMPVYIPEIQKKSKKELDLQIKNFDQERFRLYKDKKIEKTNYDSDIFRLKYLLNYKNVEDESKKFTKKTMIEKLNSDIFVNSAMRVLQDWNFGKVDSNIKKNFIEFQRKESEKIIEKLSNLGIDWSLNPFLNLPSHDDLELNWYSEKVTDDVLSLKVQIKNVGNIVAQRLMILTNANNALLDGLEFPIGKIYPGEVISRKISIKYSSGMMDEVEPVEINLFDQNIKKIKSLSFKLNFLPKRNPSFQLSTKIFDNGELGSLGNGDGKIQPNETIALSFKIENRGEEIVPELLLKIIGTDGKFRINRGKIILKKLVPFEEQQDYFHFQTLAKSNDLGKIRLEIFDTTSANPKIVRNWNLNENFLEKSESIPIFSLLKLIDIDGNILEGKSKLDSLILTGKVKESSNLRDIFVHLNDKKVFYSSDINLLSDDKFRVQKLSKNEFQFDTNLKLEPGNNRISVFARNKNGTRSERRLKIYLHK